MLISNKSRIVRASWNQSHSGVFTAGYAGIQCCMMALANIVRVSIITSHGWSTNTLDMNMIEGDRTQRLEL